MLANFEPYTYVIYAFGVIGIMLITQLIVLEVFRIRAGHVPGTTVKEDHEDFIFRAVRAFENTNETVTIFIVATLFAMLVGANSAWVNGLVSVYIIARIGHTIFYYMNIQIPRSLCFIIASLSILVILITGFIALM